MTKPLFAIGVLTLLIGHAADADDRSLLSNDKTLVVTATNAANNALLIFNSSGALLHTISTQGQGGVSGNSGGIAFRGNQLAVVNFGSGNVSILRRVEHANFHVEQLVSAVASPVSVAFGNDHLYILSTTHVESHRIDESGVDSSPDGMAALVHADGSAAQVGVLNSELIMTEKSNAIETVNLNHRGAIVGAAALVANIPANVDAPFGLVTRGNEAYVTIAHANEISLVRHNAVLTTTSSGTQMAPCWVALDGPYLFSANTPSKSVSRYVVYGQKIVQDAAVVAQFNGGPTDIASRHGLVAVIDGSGGNSHVSVFNVDEDGNLMLKGVATLANMAVNGVAIVKQGEDSSR